MNFRNTRITQLLKIKYPILEGGMAWAGTSILAAAVSNAGGLGTIGSGSMDRQLLTQEIKKIKTMTDKPFAVNIMLLNPYAQELVETVIEEKVPCVVFGAGNPATFLPALKKNGTVSMAVVSSENLAVRLERSGIDAIIGEGMESGGHIGEVTTMVLIPKLMDCLSVPIVAAGGIADGRAMAACFALGAQGVQMGTRFIASKECLVHEEFKNKIIKAGIRDTVITGQKLGHSARVIKTNFAKKVCQLELTCPEQAEEVLIGSLKRAVLDGDVQAGAFMAGQCSGLIENIEGVGDIMEKMIFQAEKIFCSGQEV